MEFTEGFFFFFLYTLLLKGELVTDECENVTAIPIFNLSEQTSKIVCVWGGRNCFALLMKNITNQPILSCRVAASRIGVKKAIKNQKEISI